MNADKLRKRIKEVDLMHLIMIFSLLSIISLFAFSASRLLDAETQPIPVKVRKTTANLP